MPRNLVADVRAFYLFPFGKHVFFFSEINYIFFQILGLSPHQMWVFMAGVPCRSNNLSYGENRVLFYQPVQELKHFF